MLPLLALVAVTAVWGVTFVQIKGAGAVYPLFAFLAFVSRSQAPCLRFLPASACGRSAGEGRARRRCRS